VCVFQYGGSDSYRVATTQDKDKKESPKKKGGKDLDDLKKEVPIVSSTSSFLPSYSVVRRNMPDNLVLLWKDLLNERGHLHILIYKVLTLLVGRLLHLRVFSCRSPVCS